MSKEHIILCFIAAVFFVGVFAHLMGWLDQRDKDK